MFSDLNFADIALWQPLETLEALLEKDKTLVNHVGHSGQTALHKSVLAGLYEHTSFLLRNGADPNIFTHSGDTCLHIACSKGILKILALLLKYNGNPDLLNSKGMLPLHCAAQCGNILIVQYLSEVFSCDLQTPDDNGCTVLQFACFGGHLDLVKFLIEVKKVSSSEVDANGNTVLHKGASGGVSGVCWSILNSGQTALLLTKNKNGQIPFDVAESSPNATLDCRTWLAKWTRQYKRKRSISSPKLEWISIFITPFLIFHLTIVFSVLLSADKQWTVGIPGAILFLYALKRQEHRIKHPARWSNPVYLGIYLTGFLSSVCSYYSFMFKYFVLHSLHWLSFGLISLLGYFVLYLLRENPGTLPPDPHIKDALVKLSEDRLEGHYCSQCFVSSSDSSHHCRLCQKCYSDLDHHCLFLNTCIAVRNHWHFVIFLMLNISGILCYFGTMVLYIRSNKDVFQDWINAVGLLLCYDMWTLLLIPFHLVCLCWCTSLLKHQYDLISVCRTTYKSRLGLSQMVYSPKQKLFNFLRFLYYKKISERNSHRFEA